MDESLVKKSLNLMKECLQIPKIELHAHLNGSIRKQTFLELLPQEYQEEAIKVFQNMSYKNAFKIFSYLGKVVTDLSVVRRVTREMIEDWNKQNCIYLEIRTTLKRINGTSKADYIDAILEEIDEGNKKYDIETRLIISVNRDLPLSEAEDSLDTYIKYESPLKKLIVGVDYCGYEIKEIIKLAEIIPVLNKFKANGLKVTYHIAESKNYQMLDFNKFLPDRLGHTYFFSDEHFQEVISQKIPVEFCPSSAVSTVGLDSMKKVPWNKYYDNKNGLCHPISINTDDTLIFATDLTQECFELCLAFDMTTTDILNIYLSTVDVIFESDEELKEKLRRIIRNWKF
jgi:adenosine deaminase